VRRSLALVLCSALLLVPAIPGAAAVHAGWRVKVGIRLMAVTTAPDGSVYIVGDERSAITRKRSS
jgi:hypothetical protein